MLWAAKDEMSKFEQAMDVVCGECCNTDGDQCDACWVRRSWRNMNASDSALEEEPKPKETFIIEVTTLLGQSFAIEADNMEDARNKAETLINNRKFFDEWIHAKWSYENEWDASEVTNVYGGWTTYDFTEADDLITQEVIDRYLNGEE